MRYLQSNPLWSSHPRLAYGAVGSPGRSFSMRDAASLEDSVDAFGPNESGAANWPTESTHAAAAQAVRDAFAAVSRFYYTPVASR
jgi:hypothetical protein